MMLLLCVFAACALAVSCKDEQGNAVDWFVAMKIPASTSYYYTDANSNNGLQESSGSLSSSGAIYNSVSSIYRRGSDEGLLVWNDEDPDGKDPSDAAHAKGLLYFDSQSGMYLIHSVPKFPPTDSYEYPSNGVEYGQSFMCLSLGSDVSSVISSLIVTHPGIYVQSANSNLRSQYASLNSVMNGNFTRQPLGTSYAISTAAGVPFTLFAKNKEWDRYLYEQLVAPVLNSDLVVESWTNGADSNIDPSFCKNRTIRYSVYNAMHINFGEGAWPRTHDHSKWAVGVHNTWLCIGGINRQFSQNLRGGGTCCTAQLPQVHDSMYSAIVDVNACGTTKVTPVGSQPPMLQLNENVRLQKRK